MNETSVIEIGKKIKEKRENKRWSQNDLARLMGVTAQAVCSWEKGRNIPTMLAVEKLANLFNCSKYELMGEEVAQAVADFDNFMPDGKYEVFQEDGVMIARPTEPQVKIGGAPIDVNTAIAYSTKLNSLSDNDKRLVYSIIDRLTRS